MTTAIFARVSTERQLRGTSLDTQVDECLELAESLAKTVDPKDILRKQGSGSDPARSGLDDLRDLLELRPITDLIVHTPDRISRNATRLMIFKDFLDTLDVTLHFVRGPESETSDGRLMLYVAGYKGQRERQETIERTRRAKRAIAESGRLPIGTSPLYGYDYDKRAKTRCINTFEAMVVRWMYQQYVAGNNEHTIAADLNAEGIRTRRGAQWQAISVKRILTNSSYIGETWYGKVRHKQMGGGKVQRTPLPESEWVRVWDFTPGIVSPRLYQEVQDRKASPKGLHGKRFFDYLLTRFVRCATCSARVKGASRRGGRRNYRCNATFATAAKPATCTARQIPADRLESTVWDRVAQILSHPDLISQSLEEYQQTDESELEQAISLLQRDISKAKFREKALVERYADGHIDEETLREQVGPIRLTRTALDDQLLDAQRALATHQDLLLQRERIAQHCRQVREGLDVETFEGKRKALTAIGAQVIASYDEVTVHISLPPEIVAKVV